MKIINSKVEEFCAIYREVYGEDISLDEGRAIGSRLASLLFHAYSPIENNEEQN